jgi:predicted phosphoadenosine phosphosulfate sulfurtransferase
MAKIDLDKNVYEAAKERIAHIFDNFQRVYVSFSGGKDSTVLLHMVADEAKRRGVVFAVLIIDLEAQYEETARHLADVVREYREYIDVHWVCLPMVLRNAVTAYEPRWTCWDEERKDIWVRKMPQGAVSNPKRYPFFVPGMEFEEFMVLWGDWYAGDIPTAGFIGIRADESLNRYRTIASHKKQTFNGVRWTTKVTDSLYNVYPLYDWKTADIWRYHAKFPEKSHNKIYDMMHKAGVPLSQQRLCQPYGDDQRKGLWLFHVIEPKTWPKIIARVNGANTGSLYAKETGNIMGVGSIVKPDGHTWESFTKLLLKSLPKPTREHYAKRFGVFIKGWKGRGYVDGIPDEAPKVLEDAQWAPSWRRLCKCLLRNDWWCKGLGLTQPKSEAYSKYLDIKKKKQAELAPKPDQASLFEEVA